MSPTLTFPYFLISSTLVHLVISRSALKAVSYALNNSSSEEEGKGDHQDRGRGAGGGGGGGGVDSTDSVSEDDDGDSSRSEWSTEDSSEEDEDEEGAEDGDDDDEYSVAAAARSSRRSVTAGKKGSSATAVSGRNPRRVDLSTGRVSAKLSGSGVGGNRRWSQAEVKKYTQKALLLLRPIFINLMPLHC